MIELEKTYLAKKLPTDFKTYPFVEIIDIYFPQNSSHPKLRLRKIDNNYQITKKEPLKKNDASSQIEQTIKLTPTEYLVLSKIPGHKIHKYRYYYPYQNRYAQIDIFQKTLKGLVLIDFEFESEKEKNRFIIPDFCLTDVTQKKFIAGGKLCNKSYQDIESKLKKLNYTKL